MKPVTISPAARQRHRRPDDRRRARWAWAAPRPTSSPAATSSRAASSASATPTGSPPPGLLELLGVDRLRNPAARRLPATAPDRMTCHPSAPRPREDHRDAPRRSQPAGAPTPNGPVPERLPRERWQRRELVDLGRPRRRRAPARWRPGCSRPGTWARCAPNPTRRYPAVVAQGRALVVACRDTAWSAAQATKAVAAVTRQGGQVAVSRWSATAGPSQPPRPAGSGCWNRRPGR